MTAALPALLAGAAVLVLLPGQWRVPRSRALPRGALPVGAAAVGAAVGGPALGVVGAAAALAVRHAGQERRTRRDRDEERAAAGEALAVLAGELRAGRPAHAALAAAAEVARGPFGSALSAAAAGGALGADAAPHLLREAGRSAVPDVLRGLAACWRVCATTGGGLAPSVGRLEDAVRAQRAQELAVAAELAGPRATAALLAGLPVAGLAMAAALGADPLHVLLRTALGGACLVAGTGLDLLGLWWTARIVEAAERPR